MSFQDSIEEMRRMAQPFWILYRTGVSRIEDVREISRSTSDEYSEDRMVDGIWYKTQQSANYALLARKIRRGDLLPEEERETIAALLDQVALSGEQRKEEMYD